MQDQQATLLQQRPQAIAKQEEEKGFRERLRQSSSFFRKGVVGSWREQLTPELIEKLILDHGPAMRQLGYLDDHGNATC